MNKHLIWVTGLIIITLCVCGTLIYLTKNPYTIRFEMDDNTRDAILGINISDDENYFSNYYVLDNFNQTEGCYELNETHMNCIYHGRGVYG